LIVYPIHFEYSARASSGTASTWTTVAPEGRAAVCAIPPEFDGPGKGYSPEDFFGLAKSLVCHLILCQLRDGSLLIETKKDDPV
jgi:hypothetical protein